MQQGRVDRWRRILVATTGTGVLVGAAWMGFSDLSALRSEREAAPPSTTSRARVPLDPRVDEAGPCAFGAGARMAYEVTTRTSARLDLSPLSDDVRVGGGSTAQVTAPQARQATRRWHLDLQVVGRAADGARVLAARVLDRGTEAEGQTTAVDERLTTPFLVRLDPRCGIREFGWRTEGDLAAAREQQALVAALGFWAPRGDGAQTYGGSAFDALGRYRAVYRAEPDGHIEGHVEHYAVAFASRRSPVPPTIEVDRSTLSVELAAGAWMQSLSSERAVILAVEDETIGTMHGRVEARRTEPGDWAPQVQLRDGGWSFGLLLEELAAEAVEAPVEAALVGMPLGEALERYLAMIRGRQSTAQYAGFLRQWLRANPTGAADLVAMLAAGGFDDEALARSALFYALGTANTPEATAALVDLVGGEDTRLAHRISAAHALSQLEHPPPEAVEALVAQVARTDLHPAARSSLAMALGTLAHHSDERAPELAQQARDQIEGWLRAPADDDALSGSLLAAGNAGHDDLAPVVAPYLDHEQPRIRRQAAHALRQMSPEEAFPRLQSGLDDTDRGVRVEVLATATEISRRHGVAPPHGMIDTAADWLGDSNDRSEEQALLALLGEAARRGSDTAETTLRARLEQALASDERDPAQLRALGAHGQTHWERG